MKFIVDAQLPKTLSDLLNYRGHDAFHTIKLQNRNATSDKVITEIAVNEDRIVVTKDNHFLESFLLNSRPRKIILVSTGNIPNKLLLKIFNDNLDLIVLLISRSNLIEITQTEITEHD